MKIFIKAKPGSKEALIKKIDDINFEVSVRELPVKGRANRAIIDSLAEYFNIGSESVKIVSGWTSRQKVIEILTNNR